MTLPLACLLACASACLADVAPGDGNTQRQFITSLCRDNTGYVWIGTEDNGVWRCARSASKDKQYTRDLTKDELSGVSVFNGKQ